MGRMQEHQPQTSALFPKIFRFITERAVLVVISLVSLVLLTAIVMQGLQLQKTLHQSEIAKAKRAELTKELAYWQDVVRQYGNYRDAYFKIATIQYQLGQVAQAKSTLEKVIALDPNFENAKVLGAKISAQ